METRTLANLSCRHEGGTAILTLERPERLNALSAELLTELLELWRELDHDGRTRAAILTGGDKAFAAGADVADMASMSSQQALAFSQLGHSVTDQMERCSFPIIAAVQGFALGGGCELALAADFIIAAENAVFGQPEVKLGLIPGFGGTQRLAHRVGTAKARQLIYTGDSLKAAAALACGLVVEVVRKQELLDRALSIARRISQNAPLAVSAAKRALDASGHIDPRTGGDLESHAFASLFASEDTRRGIDHFVHKRGPAEFEGR